AKPKRNPPKPRFFERSTPNQMWQSDIFTFRLGGKNAYLIGFIDDHSRYIVGLDLFRSQTAEHVLELYRTAAAEYGVPKEMLTDNGRQYATWRGKTRFQQELQKDRVHHIRSSPHHPMTLGKIERFWKTIWEDFLVRAQFDSFDQARERVRLWVKYYNHKRPHQSLDGLFPAIGSLPSRRNCEPWSSAASPTTSRSWRYAANPKSPSTWSGVSVSNRSCCAPRKARSRCRSTAKTNLRTNSAINSTSPQENNPM